MQILLQVTLNVCLILINNNINKLCDGGGPELLEVNHGTG